MRVQIILKVAGDATMVAVFNFTNLASMLSDESRPLFVDNSRDIISINLDGIVLPHNVDTLVDRIKLCPNLQAFSCCRCTCRNDAIISPLLTALRHCQMLQTIALSNTFVGVKGIPILISILQTHVQLVSLELRGCHLGIGGEKALISSTIMLPVKLNLDYHSEAEITRLRRSILLEKKLHDRSQQVKKYDSGSGAAARGFFAKQKMRIGEAASHRTIVYCDP